MFDFLTPKVPQVETKDLFEAIQKKEDFVLLDVRTPEEYSKEKIKGSINLSVDKINEIEKIIPDKDKTVYVYCQSGSRSSSAVNTMLSLGYKKVFSVKGGILAWQDNNFPL